MKSMGSLANNVSAWITLADGRPLKSILKKPKLPSDVPGKDGRVRIDVADGNHAIGTVVGSGSYSKAAVPNPSEWFEAAVEPDGVKGCNDYKESIGGVNMEVTKVSVWIKMRKVPVIAYSEDGLSLIATQVGKPMIEDMILKLEVSMASLMRKGDESNTGSGHSEVFIGGQKGRREPGKKGCIKQSLNEKNSGGDGAPKPKPNAFRSNILQQLISCKGVKDPNVGSTRVKKNLVFSPQPKIHYFTRDDTDDANMDVGAECGAFSSTDTQNDDLESDEEVDEHIFPEGDQFDIRQKGSSRQ
ncbi:hypothetical protein Tco_0420453 [Tanacetum coccineum]